VVKRSRVPPGNDERANRDHQSVSEELYYLSANDLIAGYRAGTFSPLEVTDAVLARIGEGDPKLKAFVLVDQQHARAAAAASATRWIKGEPCGLLDGVPTTVKDIILTDGWPTLRGSNTVDPEQPWNEDAPATARLREHGAVLIGKTTTPEFGWKGLTDCPLTGITRNPWDVSRTPGGSSGGASAAAAAGMGALHVGTDGGGSIRIPAGFSGCVGHKPSFGRVPAYPLSPFGTIAHVGPLTRTVADAALMLTVISNPDARDWHALPFEERDYLGELATGIDGLMIAFSPTLGYAEVDEEVADLVAGAVDRFIDLGAAVEAADPGFEDPADIYNTLWKAGAVNALSGHDEDMLALLDPGLRALHEDGLGLTLSDVQAATNARGALGASMKQFHERYDLLVTPALAIPAFEVGKLAPDGYPGIPETETNRWIYWTPFSYPFNLTQQPACVVPCGFTAAGLPVGLQIIGPMHDDALVLRAAHAIETALGIDRRPEL